MFKFLAIFSSICGFVIYILFFQTSSIETHSILFKKGDNLYEVVRNDGSFGSAPAFFLVENMQKLKSKIDTGEYIIPKGDSAFSLIMRMFSGKSAIRKITFPEGYTVKMIVEKLNQNSLFQGEIKELPKEGSIMPDTYFYKFNDTRDSLINKMKQNMEKVKIELKEDNKTKLSIEQAIILASIIEKESGNQDELGLISSVFHNRLAINMRLQSDPTIIYDLSDKYGRIDRKLTRNDLFFESKYNTYRKNGIPPTPICCPGKKAIQAALNPPKTDFLYFVADGSEKKHRFSKNYGDHLGNVKLYKKESLSQK